MNNSQASQQNPASIRHNKKRTQVFPGVLATRSSQSAQEHLAQLWHVLCTGYRIGARCNADDAWTRLNSSPLAARGILYEGAALAAAVLDLKKPQPRLRLLDLLRIDADHLYIAPGHAAIGMAIARCRQPLAPAIMAAHPYLRWSVMNGYGFYKGYFDWQSSISRQETLPDQFLSGMPDRFFDTARQVYDQGLGRSLWFLYAAQVEEIAAAVNAFPDTRQNDLWTGVGIACTFAGGAPAAALEVLKTFTDTHLPFLAQGAALAARIRGRDSSFDSYSNAACKVIWKMEPAKVATAAESAWQQLGASGSPAEHELIYMDWLAQIRQNFNGAN